MPIILVLLIGGWRAAIRAVNPRSPAVPQIVRKRFGSVCGGCGQCWPVVCPGCALADRARVSTLGGNGALGEMNCRGRTLAGVPLWGNEGARFHPNPRPTDTNSASLASRPHAQRLVGSALSGLVRCCSHQNLGCGGTHPPPRPNKRRVCVKMEKTKPCYSTGARRQLPPRQTQLAASTSIPLSLPPCASGRATALTPSGALFGGRAVARAMQPLPGSAQGTRSSRSHGTY